MEEVEVEEVEAVNEVEGWVEIGFTYSREWTHDEYLRCEMEGRGGAARFL